ncbi:MAG: class I SAM-dependent methyltransferase [Betaproteobacteria bacterium]|nr:class I SAM-dependent methyltransferase [Betaproteobacteria bacterium]
MKRLHPAAIGIAASSPTAVFFLLVFAALLAGPVGAQSPATHQHSFSGAEQWAHVFDDPARDAWQKPHEVIQALGLAPDAVVADIGSGTGYFAARFANMLPKGRVYGVDIEPDMVRYLADRAKREKLNNVTAIAGAPDDARLPEKADLILMVDVFHHIEDRARYFRKLSASLKPGGRVAIIDFRVDSREGPPKAARIAPERVIAELRSAGYALAKEHGFLPNQYFLVFKPSQSKPSGANARSSADKSRRQNPAGSRS